MKRLNGAYVRLGMPQATVTEAEKLLILRDIHSRLTLLEKENERLKEIACDRSGSCGLSKKDVPAS